MKVPLYISNLVSATYLWNTNTLVAKAEYTSIFLEMKYVSIVILNVKRVSS